MERSCWWSVGENLERRRRGEENRWIDAPDCGAQKYDSRLLAYRNFTIRDPKQRVIHAAPFCDRVVHHALLCIAGPGFERGAVHQSYACRKGKGNLAAVKQAQRWTQSRKYFLKMDVRKYFDSVDHRVLKTLLRRRFKDGAFLEVMERIIDSYSTGSGKGLPIGALTSQYAANFYLDRFDHWILDVLGGRCYVRYMDDFVIWHDDPLFLEDCLGEIRQGLGAARGLELKGKPRVRECRGGLDYLGYRLKPEGIFLSKRARRRFRIQLRAIQGEGLDEQSRQQRTDALLAFTEVASCRRWRKREVERVMNSPESKRPNACCVAALGSITPGTAVQRSATGTTPRTGTGMWACVCPQLNRSSEEERLTRPLERPPHRESLEGGSVVSRDSRTSQPKAAENSKKGRVE